MTSKQETTMPSIENLIERNKQYAEMVHQPRPSLLAMMNNDMRRYGPHLLIVACIDFRCNPSNVLGLKPYECAVIRNVAGRFHTAAAEIAAFDTAFHLDRIIILQHSNCGATHIRKQQVLDKVSRDRPDFDAGGGIQLAGLEARLPVREDNDQALREDLRAAKRCGFLRKDLLDSMVGLYLDVESGLVTPVYPDTDSML